MTDERTQSRELAHPQAPPPSDGSRMLQMVVEAAKDPAIDAGKMKALVDLTTGLQDRERETEFNRSLNAAIMEMPVITRDGEIVIRDDRGNIKRKQGKFAKFEDIDRVCRPILARHNLTIRFDVGTADPLPETPPAITVRPIISHANGFTERGDAMRVPSDTSGSKNAAQAVGSAVQYAKRYVYCAILNIVTEGVDDDGNLGQVVAALPYEREQLVRAEAQLAYDQGCYQDWFDKQPPKDRAWLVGSPLHEQYGGRALPAPAKRDDQPETPEQPPKQRRGAETPPPAQTGQSDAGATRTKAQTPREWADLVKLELQKANEIDVLDAFWVGKKDLLDRLDRTDHALWQELTDAYRARRAAIDDGRLV